MRALLVLLTGCSYVLEGPYTATVTTTLDGVETETVEEIEIAERDLGDNERALRRAFDCELVMFKQGGYGLNFVAGTTCTRDGESWTLQSGTLPNEDSDTVVIDLGWEVGGRSAAERLMFER